MRALACLVVVVVASTALGGCVFGGKRGSGCGRSTPDAELREPSACDFTCEPGATLSVRVEGPGAVEGRATCGGVTAQCTGDRVCTDTAAEKITANGQGTCSIARGRSVQCDASQPI